MRRQRLIAFLLTSPWSVTFLLFWAFPLVFSFLISLTDYRLLTTGYSFVGFDNYRALFSDADFVSALKNTAIFVAGTIPVTTVIALVMALLVHPPLKGRGIFRSGLFLPWITSLVVVALIFTNLYGRGGYIAVLAQMVGYTPPVNGFLYDNSTALYSIMAMDVWTSVGYYMLIFLAGLQAIPDELYEAAEVVGASKWRQFYSITLPMLRPVAIFVVVINSIKSFQVFIEIFIMTKGKFETATMVYYMYDTGLSNAFRIGYASAAAYVLFAIVAVFAIAQLLLLRRRGPVW
jgi:multiple sugar transport system permease protein